MRHPSKVIYADASLASCSIKHRVFLLCINSKDKHTLRLFIVRYSSGQRGQTVNLLTNVYEGSNPSLSTTVLRGRQERAGQAGVAQW